MSDKNRKSIALLVDYDNFNEDKYFKILFDELVQKGEVIIGRAYFSQEDNKKIPDKFRNLGLDPIYQLRFSKGKNAVDIRMSIEAIELLSKDYIDAFCLATHDSDFTPLVKKLKENNKYIIGAGRDNVSKHFKDSCDYFINVEQISNAKETQTKKDVKQTEKIDSMLNKLIKLADGIIIQNSEPDGYLLLSRLMDVIYIMDKEFNPKNYGATNNKITTFFQTKLSGFYELTNEKNTWKIRILPTRKENHILEEAKTPKAPQKSKKMKNDAKTIIENHIKLNNNKGNIQKAHDEVKKKVPGFTLEKIGHTRFINLLKEFNYKLEGNNFSK